MTEPIVTIDLRAADGSTLEDVLAELDLTGVEFSTVPDDGYESVFTDTVAEFATTSATAMKNVIAKLRDFADTSKSRQISITIDGKRVALGDLTDAQVEALLPA